MSHRNAPVDPAGPVTAGAALPAPPDRPYRSRGGGISTVPVELGPPIPPAGPGWPGRSAQYPAPPARCHRSADGCSDRTTAPDRKWSARLIAVELTRLGDPIATRTVGRWLERLGLNQRRFLDTDGTPLRTPGKITARFPGHMLHLDVKKVGRIPQGGGWRTHGRGSAQDKAAGRAKTAGAKAGFVYLHSAVDGYS